ncbi:hypothetical protein [Mesorhizobium sp.]|uniref:hypothetical protein n=1 Tax=Mesorhizobium sp. TaxID=1871066 RepID=UPI00257E2B7F|nr:hypothetical protein [Mesorhizobium sp.]
MQKTAMRFTRRLGSSQPCLFGFATGFQDLVEGLVLPAYGVPVELLDGVIVGMHGRLVISLPVDPWPMLWFLTLLGMRLQTETNAEEYEEERAGGILACGDNKVITLSIASEDHYWPALCKALVGASGSRKSSGSRTTRR